MSDSPTLNGALLVYDEPKVSPDLMFVSPRVWRALVHVNASLDAKDRPGFDRLNWRRQKREMRKAGDAAVRALDVPTATQSPTI